ncbi:MAG: radical SAM protein [Deltaproteobacteria bacterium]|nr:radical SAM protein [Deltaproteobacteria bacterium]
MPVEPAPKSCYWELTRRCQLGCLHCRSSSGPDVTDPDLEAAFRIADQLIAAKTRLVVLTGGEPTLFPHWERVAERLARGGCLVRLFTNGVGFTRGIFERALAAGVTQFAVSLDGPRFLHDRLRPSADADIPSTYDEAAAAIDAVARTEWKLRVVTQVNRLNADALDQTYEILLAMNVKRWQVHLCQMTGRARDHRDRLMSDPADLEKSSAC